jgi:hypothetical protein
MINFLEGLYVDHRNAREEDRMLWLPSIRWVSTLKLIIKLSHQRTINNFLGKAFERFWYHL